MRSATHPSPSARFVSATPARRRILRRWQRARQAALFCACGEASPVTAGLCKPCYRTRWRDRRYFGGQRDQVLERDCRQCQLCSGTHTLNVHHRRPGQNAADQLLTLCAGCHARIHRLQSIRRWLPSQVVRLWEEVHPGQPVQLQLWD